MLTPKRALTEIQTEHNALSKKVCDVINEVLGSEFVKDPYGALDALSKCAKKSKPATSKGKK